MLVYSHRIIILIIFQFLVSSILVAHPMPNSMVQLMTTVSSIKGIARMPLLDLQAAIKDSTIDFQSESLNQYFAQRIEIKDVIQQWITKIDSITLSTENDKDIGMYNEVNVYFHLIPPNKTVSRGFDFYYSAIIHEVVTHSALVFLHSDWGNGLQPHHDPIPLGEISIDTRTGNLLPLHVVLPKINQWKAFTSYIGLGMHHISEGVDHLMFLLTLLLPVCLISQSKKWAGPKDWANSIKHILLIITAFTIGHSITLIICTFNTTWLPLKWIELGIAISILISSLHALTPLFNGYEKRMALSFGLLHGMAFSSSISKIDLSTKQLVISLLGFNIGIEIMQMMIIMGIVPFILVMSRYRLYSHVRILGALIAIVASIAWIIERWSEKENIIAQIFNGLHNHALYIFLTLAILTLSIAIFSPKHAINKNTN